ncbi:MAG: Co2+/Mg2+ efflux protein ApaG [Pseudomonadota bacterium]
MYQQKTRSIEISVEPFYVDEQSSPSSNRFVFGYRVKIDNQGHEAVQLMNRYWQITDALGRTVEVEGPGVVGEQPLIEPGDHFEYTSGTPLATPSGVMIGRYQMVTESGETFDAAIPAFSLDAPGAQMRMN